MNKWKQTLGAGLRYLAVCGRWLVLAALAGCLAGPLGAAFGLALNWANALRARQGWLLFLLPLGGLVLVFLYRHANAGSGSTDQVLAAVKARRLLPLRAAPLIFFATVTTHLLGGSSGREGAALLLGGSVLGPVGRLLRLGPRGRRLLTMCGMAGAFAAIFGTPLAAAVFVLEVVEVGAMPYASLLPCLVSALVGVWIGGQMGLAPTAFALDVSVQADPLTLLRVLALGALAAGLSILFCGLLHGTARLYARWLPNPYLRIAVGGVLIIALTLGLGTTDYNGAGSAVIAAAVAGQALPWAFALKMLFTALTLGAGYKGGEIVPIFFTGATFGCVVAPLLGLPAPLGAALGMVALFCGCTNSPLASLCLGLEVFGGRCLPLFALACAAAYMLSGYFGLYREQGFSASKLRLGGVVPTEGRWAEAETEETRENELSDGGGRAIINR